MEFLEKLRNNGRNNKGLPRMKNTNESQAETEAQAIEEHILIYNRLIFKKHKDLDFYLFRLST